MVALIFKDTHIEFGDGITETMIPHDTPLLRDDWLPIKDSVARAILAGCTTFGDIAALTSGKATVAPEANFSAMSAAAAPDEPAEGGK